ncbi:hypothetical protein I7I53_09604 [Histoplasma capsulatum var. duboisii H88]|uniref:Uncharacterized protein n=1 Tax=Ajellomyces capsulatus (strain H88) TaxID=544711 RepID=A0A8A1L4G4_AJEC8|nr:hypothetical protein I7I53_09604 [Histoplasma capsulatum var. duboisii H88]
MKKRAIKRKSWANLWLICWSWNEKKRKVSRAYLQVASSLPRLHESDLPDSHHSIHRSIPDWWATYSRRFYLRSILTQVLDLTALGMHHIFTHEVLPTV